MVISDVQNTAWIDKSIYLTYPTRNFPDEIRRNIARIQKLNPDWAITIFSDEDIIEFIRRECSKELLDAYLSINPEYGAAKADLFRYLILYVRGGVYLDIKSSLNKSLGDIITDPSKLILAQWDNGQDGPHKGWGLHKELVGIDGGEYIQWFIAAPRGSDILGAVIDRVVHNIRRYNPFVHGVGKMGTLRVTGPIAYTLAIQPRLNAENHVLYRDYRNTGLVYSIYEESGSMGGHKDIFIKHYAKLQSPITNHHKIFNTMWRWWPAKGLF